MKMGRKYQIDALCTAVVKHLEQQWPLTEEGMRRFLRLRADDEDSCSEGHHDDPPRKHVWKMHPEPASAIRLAVDFDIPSILPAAFYLLTTIALYDKWPKSEKPGTWPRESARLARWDLLRERERLTYYESKDKLSQTQLELEGIFRGRIILPSDDECLVEWTFDYTDEEDPEGELAMLELKLWDSPCARAANGFLLNNLQREQSARWILTSPDPITLLLRLEKSIPSMNLCRTCQVPVKRRLRQEMKKIWERFVKAFDL